METINIKPDADDITGLLERLREGELLVPKFQREFIWDKTDIRDLFDSILKGYPVGSLIFWKPADEKFKVYDEIGGIRIVNKNPPALYVLDGRQRLTALISVLQPGGENYDKFFLNLEEDMVEYSHYPRKDSRYISLANLFNTYSIIDYLDNLRESGLPADKQKEYSEKVKEYNRVLLKFKLGYVILRGGTIKEAVEVFSRLNSKGVGISPDYMLQALAYDSENDFRLASRISEIISRLERYNFGNLKRDIVFNCLFNYTDVPFIDGKISHLLDLGVHLPEIVDRLREDLDRAVRFLFMDCHVIEYRLLPYSYQLIMVCDFFRVNSAPSAEALAQLKRWFFYTTFAGYFTSHSLAEVRTDIARFREFARGETDSPIDYAPIGFQGLPASLNLSGVKAKGFVLSMLMKKEVTLDSELVIRKILPKESKTPANCIIATGRKEAESLVADFMEEGFSPTDIPTRNQSLENMFSREVDSLIYPLV